MLKLLKLFVFVSLTCLTGCEFICPDAEEDKKASDSANIGKVIVPISPVSESYFTASANP